MSTHESAPSALDADFDKLDAHEQNFVSTVRDHGWHLTNVFADEKGPGFSYSTGIWLRTGFPELIIFSYKKELVHNVFWDIYRDIQAGRSPPIRRRSSQIFANLDAALLPCARRFYREYLGWSRWFYGDDNFECVQVVWPDKANKFPWEAGFDSQFEGNQPDLTENGWVSSLEH